MDLFDPLPHITLFVGDIASELSFSYVGLVFLLVPGFIPSLLTSFTVTKVLDC